MQITAKKREKFGKQVKKIRLQNSLPAVVMEKGKKSLPVVLSAVEFNKVFKEVGETSLIDFNLDGTVFKALVSEVQLHPISMKPIHVVFRKVDLKEKLTAQIPVEIINEDQNPLVKSGEAIVLKLLDEIAVEALPSDLPKQFVIDALRLVNVGDEITIGQLEYDKNKVKIVEYGEEEAVAKLDKVEEMKVEEEAAISEEEAVAQVKATQELSDEERAAREAARKEEKAEKEKADKK